MLTDYLIDGVVIDVEKLKAAAAYREFEGLELRMPEMDLTLARMLLVEAEQRGVAMQSLEAWRKVIATMEVAAAEGYPNTFHAKLRCGSVLGGRMNGVYETMWVNGEDVPKYHGCMVANTRFFKDIMFKLSGHFVDIDQARSHPTNLYLAGENLKRLGYDHLTTDAIRNYLANRDQIVAEVIQYCAEGKPNSFDNPHLETWEVKAAFSRASYLGTWQGFQMDMGSAVDKYGWPRLRKKIPAKPPAAWGDFQREARNIGQVLRGLNPDYCAHILQVSTEAAAEEGWVFREQNPNADIAGLRRFMSYYLQTVEFGATYALYHVLVKEQKWVPPGCFDEAHDGLTVWIPPEVAEDPGAFLESHMEMINERVGDLTGLRGEHASITFCVKPFEMWDGARQVFEKRRRQLCPEPVRAGVQPEDPEIEEYRAQHIPRGFVQHELAEHIFVQPPEDSRHTKAAAKANAVIEAVKVINKHWVFDESTASYISTAHYTTANVVGQIYGHRGTLRYADDWVVDESKTPGQLTEIGKTWGARYEYREPRKPAGAAPETATVASGGASGARGIPAGEEEVESEDMGDYRSVVMRIPVCHAWTCNENKAVVAGTEYAPFTYHEMGRRYLPNQMRMDEDTRKFVKNRFVPMRFDYTAEFRYVPDMESVSHVFHFLEHVTLACGEEYKVAQYETKKLAHMVQNAMSYECFAGPEGSGKGTLGNIAKNLFGAKHVFTTTKPHEVFEEKNAIACDRLLLILNESSEATWKSSYENTLKTLCTDADYTIRAMYRGPVQTKQYSRIWRTLNLGEIVEYLGRMQGNRRCMLLLCSNRATVHDDYFVRLDKLSINDHALIAIMWFLQRVDLTNWSPKTLVFSRFHRSYMCNSEENKFVLFLIDVIEQFETGYTEYGAGADNQLSRHLGHGRHPVKVMEKGSERTLVVNAACLFEACEVA
jgi:hypothetical protein